MKFILGLSTLVLTVPLIAQDCALTHTLFADQAKMDNYEAAYPYLQEVRKSCPDYHISTYQYGDRIYKDRLEKAAAGDKLAVFNEYKQFYQERFQYFPQNTPEGKMLADLAQVQFDYNLGSRMEQYRAFENAYNKDKDGFTSAKSIYTYFSLAVDLFTENQLPVEEVFTLYDELIAKIEKEENDLAGKITPLIEKQDRGVALEAAEERLLKAGETNLDSYSKIKNGINGKLGNIADCDNLILLYEKDFEANKTDIKWLQGVNSRLSAKECTEPFSFRVAEALHAIEPSASSAYIIGARAENEGNINAALEYYNQAAELFTDNTRKAQIYAKIGDVYRKRGNLSNARNYYRKAIDSRPSFGYAYLQIAAMYSSSSNDCGATPFEKRAINWLAAEQARTAARVDPSVAATANAAASSYMQRAPQRQDIFIEGMEGKTIVFSCWIGGSIKVPSL